MEMLVGAIVCAVAFTLVGLLLSKVGATAFVLIVVAVLGSLVLANRLPIDRWRWRYSRWRHR